MSRVFRPKPRKDKKIFRATAIKTNKKNLVTGVTPRGGIRL